MRAKNQNGHLKILKSLRVGSIKIALFYAFSLPEKVTESPFLSLAMDLPPPPLYLDERLQNIIPVYKISKPKTMNKVLSLASSTWGAFGKI